MKLQDKVILITGASRGIGREVAILLSENGAKVVVNYSSSEKEANKTVAHITKRQCHSC